MQEGDKVIHSDLFKEKYGDHFDAETVEAEGEVLEVGENRAGQQVCLVEWHSGEYKWNPQSTMAFHLKKIGSWKDG